MADPQTWIDVAGAAVPVLGTLGGAAVGAWGQTYLAKVNSANARQLAADERREAQRRDLFAAASTFLQCGQRVVGRHHQALESVMERRERIQQKHSWAVTDFPDDLQSVNEDVGRATASLMLLAQDDSLHTPVVRFNEAMTVEAGLQVKLREAARASDEAAYAKAHDEIVEQLKIAHQSLKNFEAAARKLLGVPLALPSAVHDNV